VKKFFISIFFLTFSSLFCEEILISKWDFEEKDKNLPVITDKVFPYAHGKLKGKIKPEFIKVGETYVLKFNGDYKQRVEIEDEHKKFITDFKNGLIIEVKFQIDRINKGVQTIFGKYAGGEGPKSFCLFVHDKYLQFMVISEDKYEIVSGGEILPKKWYKVKAIFNPGNSIEVYIDGKLKGKKKIKFENLNIVSEIPLSIGCRYWKNKTAPINFLYGAIDEITVKTFKPIDLKEVWKIEDAWKIDNGFEGKICLNGLWKYYPCRGKEKKIPENWYFRNVPSGGGGFPVYDEKLREVKKINGIKVKDGIKCWQERELKIPENWKNRDIFVDIYNVRGGGEIYIDKEFKGYLWENVPARVKIGYKQKPVKITILSNGIIDNVFLVSFPKNFRIEETYLTTSYRKKKLFLNIKGTGKLKNETIYLLFSEKKDFRNKIILGPYKISVDKENWEENFEFPLDKRIKLWSRENPNLYWYAVEIKNKEGKIIDRSLPVRTGLREFWIENGDFYLNGKPIYFYGDNIVEFNNSPDRMAILGNEEAVKNMIEGRMSVGANTWAGWVGKQPVCWELPLEISDEKGITVALHVPHYGWPRIQSENEEIINYGKEVLSFFIRRYRHHPSVFLWIFHTSSAGWTDYCPYAMDGSIDPYKIFPELKKYHKRVIEAMKFTKKIDPTRPTTFNSGGNCGEVWTSMAYMNFDTELQEQENWPYFWYKNKHKPVLPTEMWFPFDSAWFTRKVRSDYPKKGSEILSLEFSAMYFGDKFYKGEDEKEILNYLKPKSGNPMSSYWARPPSLQNTMSLIAKNCIKSWRTYGISFLLHCELSFCFENTKLPELIQKNPKRPYPTGDISKVYEWKWYHKVGELNLIGKSIKESLSPLLVYIGGPEEFFTKKDHTYFSEDILKKSIIVINDTEKAMNLSGFWWIEDEEGNVIYRRKVRIVTEPGKRTFKKISFRIPEVQKRKDYYLKVELKTKEKTLKDVFKICVFPKENLNLSEKVFLFDEVGDTEKMLKMAGIKYEKIEDSIPDKGIFVIGRHNLENEEKLKILKKLDFDKKVENGLKVIVFEQATENLMGLKLLETSTRHVFIRSPNHPVVECLKDEDFQYWKGDSDLLPPFEKINLNLKGNPERFWRYLNDNVVATYVIEKPQIGSFRAIVDCGFDLLETPLIEFTKNKGRLIFCQLDVTNRYGYDPVATKIVNNIFSYMTKAKTPDLNSSPVNVLKEKNIFNIGKRKILRWISEEPIDGLSVTDFFFREKVEIPLINGKDPVIFKNGIYYYTVLPEMFRTSWQKSKILRIINTLRINQNGTSQTGPGVNISSAILYPFNWHENFVHPYSYWRW